MYTDCVKNPQITVKLHAVKLVYHFFYAKVAEEFIIWRNLKKAAGTQILLNSRACLFQPIKNGVCKKITNVNRVDLLGENVGGYLMIGQIAKKVVLLKQFNFSHFRDTLGFASSLTVGLWRLCYAVSPMKQHFQSF